MSADAKLFLLGSTEEEVQAIRNGKDLPGLADLEHETQVLTARRRRGLPTSLALPSGLLSRKLTDFISQYIAVCHD